MGITGRKPDYEMIAKVKEMRKQGLSFRKISEKTNRPLKRVHFWAHYNVEERLEKEKA